MSRARPTKRQSVKKLLMCSITIFSTSIAPVWAADPPEQREGLWEMQGYSIENPGNHKVEIDSKICRDHAYDLASRNRLRNMKGCTPNMSDVDNHKYVLESRCTVNGTIVLTNTEIIIQSETALHSDSRTTYIPAFHGKIEKTFVQDQKYIGSCPPQMKPGDSSPKLEP